MCGIAGLIRKSKAATQADLKTMADAIRHRGPDGEGFFLHEQVGLTHRRLSIIDLETGQQPMHSPDGRYCIVYNGELYNFRELKRELEQVGIAFQTASDTEVLLQAYTYWGAACLQRLRGMFAFAIWDSFTKELFLARDHFGIKPLVYSRQTDFFAFASEIQALKALPDGQFTIDPASIDRFLQYKYIPAPYSIYKEVQKLPPAHYMRVSGEGKIMETQRYWNWSFQADETLSREDCLDLLDTALRESVCAHLVSDVPFGAFLSGGIDSSLVVKYMAESMHRPVQTFSIGFEDRAFDELPYAAQVSQHYGTEHHTEVVRADALHILPDLMRHFGEPFGDNSAVPMYYLSRMTRQHVTMALSGDAGDELFAGYDSYTTYWSRHIHPIPEHLGFPKKQIYPLANAISPEKFPYRTASFADWVRYGHQKENASRRALWRPEYGAHLQREAMEMAEKAFEEAGAVGHFQKAQYTDFQVYLPNDILAKVDVTGMMHSLECRTPLLDLRVLELAARIPERYNIAKVKGKWQGKMLLKNLLARDMGESFVNREKQGFASPVEQWLFPQGTLDKRVVDWLHSPDTLVREWLNLEAISKLRGDKGSHMLWNIVCLEAWCRENE